MQTFLPEPIFAKSAAVLDRPRLGKQRVETMQIMTALLSGLGESGWQHHPAVKMWRGYEWTLLQYQQIICAEWKRRGYIDTCWYKTRDFFVERTNRRLPDKTPPWLGDKDFHISHQSNLVRKDPEHYRQYYPDVPDDLPYIWPVA